MNCWSVTSSAQLQLPASHEPQRLFAGMARNVSVIFSNPGNENFDASLRLRILQTTSATAVRIADSPWKQLHVLPGQTVLETAQLDFPSVNAETKFLVQWLAGTNHVIGTTTVLVSPTNLLAEMKPMLGTGVLGVLDPNNALKPSLQQSGIEFLDLSEMALEDFSGRLAIIGPVRSKAQWREGLAQAVQKIATKGTVVVWIQPPPEPDDDIQPSFYVVPTGKGVVVIVQPELVADLPGNPRSQQNLIYFCKLALYPSPLHLPNSYPQP